MLQWMTLPPANSISCAAKKVWSPAVNAAAAVAAGSIFRPTLPKPTPWGNTSNADSQRGRPVTSGGEPSNGLRGKSPGGAGRHRPPPLHGPDLSGYDPCCPLLVDRACSAYPVRPVICRTHFVSSDPAACRPSHDLRPAAIAPVVLTSIIRAAGPFSKPLRADIENAGLDFSRSIMLLPHWLALEMGWDAPRPTR